MSTNVNISKRALASALSLERLSDTRLAQLQGSSARSRSCRREAVRQHRLFAANVPVVEEDLRVGRNRLQGVEDELLSRVTKANSHAHLPEVHQVGYGRQERPRFAVQLQKPVARGDHGEHGDQLVHIIQSCQGRPSLRAAGKECRILGSSKAKYDFSRSTREFVSCLKWSDSLAKRVELVGQVSGSPSMSWPSIDVLINGIQSEVERAPSRVMKTAIASSSCVPSRQAAKELLLHRGDLRTGARLEFPTVKSESTYFSGTTMNSSPAAIGSKAMAPRRVRLI
eukprot:4570047-Pleurochrysis_carterae.AAC.3